MGEPAPEDANQASGIAPFQVWVSDDGVANVSVPLSWASEPHLKEVLQSMAGQELNAHLGIPAN